MGNQFSKLEKMSAFQLLDEDCWRLVFRKLNGDDLSSCRQVCKDFHKLVDEYEFQQNWKFHLVVPLLFSYLKYEYSNSEEDWRNLHLLRLTCKSWRQSVDKYATEGYKPTNVFKSLKSIPLATCFRSSEHVDEFQQKFGKSDMNPFPSRTVYVYIKVSSRNERGLNQDHAEEKERVKRLQIAYIEKVGDLLEQFGKGIVKLQNAFQLKADHLTLCKFIKRISSHLPSLKTFIISNYSMGENRQKIDEQQIATFIQENPLGEMSKLKELQIDSLDTMIEDYILNKCASQLTHFERLNPNDSLRKICVEEFKTLREFSNRLLYHKDTLEILHFLQSPLKRLKFELYTVDMKACRCCEQLNWNVDKALYNIKHLPIEYLEVGLGLIGVCGGVKVVEAGLELQEYINKSIQTLHIQFFFIGQGQSEEGEISFNFLEALTKLENLELRFLPLRQVFKITHPKEVPEVVKLKDYILDEERTGTPYHSNVWEKVPSLKILTVEKTRDLARAEGGDGQVKLTYTREKYEEVRRDTIVQK